MVRRKRHEQKTIDTTSSFVVAFVTDELVVVMNRNRR